MSPYKVIMMDVDGTLSNYSPTNMPLMPTQAVQEAIKIAQSKLLIGVATSRPLLKMKPIFDTLKFNCYCILHNGAQIIDPLTLETKWMKPITPIALQSLYELAKTYGINAYFSNFENNIPIESYSKLQNHSVADVFYDGVDIDIKDFVISELEKIPEICVHYLSSRWENKIEISITNYKATKESAVFEISKFLSISPKDIVGVGDGHNDISLLNACGYKVAMGNAVEELKLIADLIVPSVQDDGVKFIIEKLLLDLSKD